MCGCIYVLCNADWWLYPTKYQWFQTHKETQYCLRYSSARWSMQCCGWCRSVCAQSLEQCLSLLISWEDYLRYGGRILSARLCCIYLHGTDSVGQWFPWSSDYKTLVRLQQFVPTTASCSVHKSTVRFHTSVMRRFDFSPLVLVQHHVSTTIPCTDH